MFKYKLDLKKILTVHGAEKHIVIIKYTIKPQYNLR